MTPPHTRSPLTFSVLLLILVNALLVTACSSTSGPTPFAECTPASQIDQPAVIRTFPHPRIDPDWYPEGATIRVLYQFEVTPEGKMGRKIYQPNDSDPRILAAIERSFSRWRFKPALRNGQPVTTCFEQPYELIFENQIAPSVPASPTPAP